MPEVVREIPDIGRLTFEEWPAGSLKPDGEIRTRDYRAYKLNGKRLPSVTTLLGAVLPAPGLIRWAEARGAEGAALCAQAGVLPSNPEDAIHAVRREGLGADAATKKGVDRGLSVHSLLQVYMETGSPPNPIDHLEAHRPFIRAFTKWCLDRNPEPISVEQIVCHELGYAGRMDLRAIIDGEELICDAKTNATGSIWPKAILQAKMYAMADEYCGASESDGELVVVFNAKGEYHELRGVATEDAVHAAVSLYQALKPINASTDAHYKKVRQ